MQASPSRILAFFTLQRTVVVLGLVSFPNGAASEMITPLLRFLNRVGKGLRTTPRDAMTAATTTGHLRGRAFGFHRAMDYGGAVLFGTLWQWLGQTTAFLTAASLTALSVAILLGIARSGALC